MRFMSELTKALRLSQDEWRAIEQFLKANPLFDFSSLARTALFAFIENPKITLNAVTAPKQRIRSTQQEGDLNGN